MYQDKSRRKRKSGRDYPPSGTAVGGTPHSDLSDVDIQRAAAGIL